MKRGSREKEKWSVDENEEREWERQEQGVVLLSECGSYSLEERTPEWE